MRIMKVFMTLIISLYDVEVFMTLIISLYDME